MSCNEDHIIKSLHLESIKGMTIAKPEHYSDSKTVNRETRR